jgi:hypothetical protein
MSIDSWLNMALADAQRRSVAPLRPMLEGLARTTAALRAADWNIDARASDPLPPRSDVR